jgi:hypothetical protein
MGHAGVEHDEIACGQHLLDLGAAAITGPPGSGVEVEQLTDPGRLGDVPQLDAVDCTSRCRVGVLTATDTMPRLGG